MDREVSFTEVCTFLDRLQRTRTVSAKKNMVQAYLNKWRQRDPDVYPLLRLLLPHLDDRSRGGSFGLKESRLADTYIATLSLSKTSHDAFALRRFEQQPHQPGSVAKHDFADVLFGILKTRLFGEPSASVADINQYLTRLSSKDNDKQALFRELLGRLTAQEHKWLTRLILKQMHLSIGDQHILKCYHEDAPALYNVCGDLQKVVKELWDPDKRLVGHGVRLMEPFKPMLADRQDVPAFLQANHDQPVVVEEKLDGERVQLHYNHATKEFKYFSRAGNESTTLYAHSLTIIIRQSFHHSVILDGEMMVFDEELQKYLAYDIVKTAAAITDATVHPVFMVFDILYVDGESVAHLPLLERKRLLNLHCPVIDDYVKVLPYEMMTDSKSIYDKLDDILLAHGEGLILKAPQGPYLIGERSDKWIKLKPDYVNALLDDFDVMVVGVYLGKGVMGRFGSISGLLCACHRPRDDKLLTFCKVGSGFNRDELHELTMLLHDSYSDEPPDDLLFVDRPDRFVDTTKSRLLIQVKGMSIVDSGVFAAGKTLRSPRFVMIRRDKTDITTVSEVETMQCMSMRSASSSRPLSRTPSGPTTPPPIDSTVKYDHFRQAIVYVHDGSASCPRQAVQAIVHALNGVTVEHPMATMSYIVADDFGRPSMRLKGILRSHEQATRMSISDLQRIYNGYLHATA